MSDALVILIAVSVIGIIGGVHWVFAHCIERQVHKVMRNYIIAGYIQPRNKKGQFTPRV